MIIYKCLDCKNEFTRRIRECSPKCSACNSARIMTKRGYNRVNRHNRLKK